MIKIDVRKDGSEKINYDYDEYYAYVRRGRLSHYPNYAADSHWHDDLEFISVISGSMDYNVNGKILRLEPGQGVVVNARRLHYGFSNERNECEFYCILLHPILLCTSQRIDRDFVAPFLADPSLPYIFLDGKVDWQREILTDVENMYRRKDKITAPLAIQSLFYHVWFTLIENVVTVKKNRKPDRNLSVLKDMLTFIQKNYARKISLDDIASSGKVSKSSCLAIFKKYLHDTPANHLVAYRLSRAVKRLRETTSSVTEIAFDVGFNGSSYFAESFKKIYGCSPSEFRKKYKGSDAR